MLLNLGEFMAYVAPLGVLSVLLARHAMGYKVAPTMLGIAIALAVSFIPDVSAFFFGYSRQWTHLYPAPQIAIMMVALTTSKEFRVMAVATLAVLAILSGLSGPWSDPEIIVRVAGGLAVAVVLWGKRGLGRTRAAMLIYFGVGALFQLAYVFTLPNFEAFLVAWFGYQVCRFTGIGMMLSHVLQYEGKRRLAVVRI